MQLRPFPMSRGRMRLGLVRSAVQALIPAAQAPPRNDMHRISSHSRPASARLIVNKAPAQSALVEGCTKISGVNQYAADTKNYGCVRFIFYQRVVKSSREYSL